MSFSPDLAQSPRWASRWLWAAGIYNLAWGALAIVWPRFLFDLTGAERINYPEIWPCVGMIVGVYGIGYLIAASDSRTHWPIVLVRLLGKIFGPIGFVVALLHGTFPPLFGLTILTNDLLWWIPFALILRDAAMNQRSEQQSMGGAPARQSSRPPRSSRSHSDSMGRHSHRICSTAPVRGSPGIRTVRLLVSPPSLSRRWSGRNPVKGRGRILSSLGIGRALARRLACSPQTGSHVRLSPKDAKLD